MVRRVMSPCIGICKLDQKSGLCLGCKRTIDEIGRWAMLDDPSRQAIVFQRRCQLQNRCHPERSEGSSVSHAVLWSLG
jgi:predicted Fe-S protein YdhL (DUF1289 family)